MKYQSVASCKSPELMPKPTTWAYALIALQDDAQPTEPHQLVLFIDFKERGEGREKEEGREKHRFVPLIFVTIS